MLRAVIFDYGGVLRGDARELWDGVDATAGLPRGTLWAAWHEIPEYRLSREGAIDALEFRRAMQRAVARVAGGDDHAEGAIAALEGRLAALPAIDAGMRTLVERLRAGTRVKLGLLSNADRNFSARLRTRGVAALFDDVLVSGEVGLAKPDPAIFRLAAARLGVAPDACLMIDDHAPHVAGAQAAGLRAVLYEPARLAELVDMLERDGVLERLT